MITLLLYKPVSRERKGLLRVLVGHYNSSIEKERLQDLMATGKLEKKPVPQRVALNDEQKEEEERERSYDESTQ